MGGDGPVLWCWLGLQLRASVDEYACGWIRGCSGRGAVMHGFVTVFQGSFRQRYRTLVRLSHSGVTVLLRVGNLRCGGCASRAEKAVRALGSDTVTSASVSPASNLGLVTLGEKGKLSDVLDALKAAGFPSTEKVSALAGQEVGDEKDAEDGRKSTVKQVVQIAALVALAAAMHAAHCGALAAAVPATAQAGITAIGTVMVPSTREIFRDGLMSLMRGEPDMNSLVAVGALTGYLASVYGLFMGVWPPFFHEQLMLLAVVTGGRAIETSLRRQASREMTKLASLQPRVTTTAQGEKILTERVEVGDRFVVTPGERFPVDCVLVTGESLVDASAVTGESVPVEVKAGMEVLSGSIHVGKSLVECEAKAKGSDSYIADVQRLVLLAQTSKTPTQRVADVIAGKFCFFVLGASVATFLAWSFVPSLAKMAAVYGKAAALRFAVGVVVIACPCAIGLATPMAVYIAAVCTARNGILFRNAEAMEQLSKVSTVVFDKTGTLTEGRFRVVEKISLVGGVSPDELTHIAAKVERFSNHPIAKAILEDAQAHPLAGEQVVSAGGEGDDHVTEVGGGVALGGIEVGSLQWLLDERGATVGKDAEEMERKLSEDANTVVAVGVDGIVVGLIGMQDVINRRASDAVGALQAAGVDVWILSGDGKEAVHRVGSLLGVPSSQLRWRLKPSEKVEALRSIQALQKSGVVAAVGDGVNDAPLLAAAQIGISIPGGSAATEAGSDVICTASDVPNAIQAAVITRNTVRTNLLWALTYNTILIPVAAGVLIPTPLHIALSPPLAAAAMSASSLTVILNSLLLLKKIPPRS